MLCRIVAKVQWIIIQTDAFSPPDRSKFDKIAAYLIGCDEITSDEMDKLIESVVFNMATVPSKRANKSDETNGGTMVGVSKPSPHCIIEYPLHERGASSVTVQSYECLAANEYLDDAIIDFYAEYLHREILTPDQRQRTHFFSVHFYNVLTGRSARGKSSGLSQAQKRHERVAKWTKDVNIFEKDFVIVPINLRNHWYLAIVCYPSLEQPVFMDTNKPVPPKKRLSANKSNDSKPIKQ